MRIKWWWRLSAVVVAVVILKFLIAQIQRSEKHLSFGGTTIIASGKPVDIWFSSPSHLVALVADGATITAKHWELPKKKPASELTFDFSQVVGKGAALDYALYQHPAKLDQHAIPYAVSLDGNSIAWAKEGKVYAKSIVVDRAPIEEVAALAENPSAIYFLRPDLLAVFRQDGKVETWDRKRKKLGRAGTWLDGQWRIWSHGPTIAISSFETRDIGRLDFDETGDYMEAKYYRTPSEEGTFLSIPDSGYIAVGNKIGQVQWISPEKTPLAQEGGRPSQVDSGPEKTQLASPVTALAFYDDRNLFALVRNGPACLISDKSTVTPVPDSPPANLLSVSKDYLALAASDQTEVTDLVLEGKLAWRKVNLGLLIAFILSIAIALWPHGMASVQGANTSGGRAPGGTDRLLLITDAIFLIFGVVIGVLWLTHPGDPAGYYEPLTYVSGLLAGIVKAVRRGIGR